MRKPLSIALSLLTSLGLLLTAAITAAAQPPQPQPPAGPTLNLKVGEGEGTINIAQFFLPDVRVAVGTTVVWTVGSDEPHFVTFLAGRPKPPEVVPQPEEGRPPMFNPEVFFPVLPQGPYDGRTYTSSGFLNRGDRYFLTFSATGRFAYLCNIHPAMTGTVEVVEPNSPGITTQADVDQYIATHSNTVHTAQISELRATRSVPVRQDIGGRDLVTVRAGTEWPGGHLELLEFLPRDITINQGDTVVWYNPIAGGLHSVTFPVPGQDPPAFLVPTLPDGTPLMGPPAGPPPDMAGPPDPSMMPRLVLGPGAFEARPGPSYTPGVLFNSGLFGDGGPGAMSSWSLTFDTPGSFNYLCVLHPGMEGTVNVVAR